MTRSFIVLLAPVLAFMPSCSCSVPPVTDGGDGDGDATADDVEDEAIGDGDGDVDAGDGEADAGDGDAPDGGPGDDAPVVVIDSPDDGEQASIGESVTFDCSATDTQDGAVDNAAITWSSDVQGPLGIGAHVINALVTPGAHTITCTATDTDGNVGSDSVTVTVVDNFVPVVVVAQPADGAFFAADQTITFSGSATDTEDGPIGNVALVWFGGATQIGVGATVQTVLALGDHTIRLGATDSDGAVGFGEITIHVVDNLPPLCTVVSPPDGAIVDEGATVTFDAACTDPDGVGPIPNASFAWSSDVQGALGLGETVLTALIALGSHVISVCATDTEDALLVGCDSVVVTVQEVNDPPVVIIEAPLDGASFDITVGALALAASATDAEDGTLIPTWSTPMLGEFATGDAADLIAIPGVHDIEARATDSGGLSGSDAVRVSVAPAGTALFDDVAAVAGLTNVTSIAVGAGDELWLATQAGLVHAAADGGVIATFTPATSDVPGAVRDIVIVDGDVALAGTTGFASGCDPLTMTCDIHVENDAVGDLGFDGIQTRAIVVLPDGRLVVAGQTCLLLYDAAESRVFCEGEGAGDGLPTEQVFAAALHPLTGDVFLATDDGVVVMTPAPPGQSANEDATSFTEFDAAGNETARAIAIAPSGDVWVATSDGAVRVAYPSFTLAARFDQDDGLPSNDVRDVAVDVVVIAGVSREVAWAATNNGLGRIDPTVASVSAITEGDGLLDDDCRAVAIQSDHTKVVGHPTGASLYRGY